MKSEPTILIVTARPSLLESLRRSLERHGCRVSAAESAAAAIEQARTSPPDAVLVDGQMADGEGLLLCRRMREQSALGDVPVVLLASALAPTAIPLALEARVDGWVSGEGGGNRVWERVADALRNRELAPPAPQRLRLHRGGRELELEADPLRTLALLMDTAEAAGAAAERALDERMLTVGKLAGGIAHELNNLLMIIRGFLDALARQSQPDDPRTRFYEQIRKATDRGVALAERLLLIGRKRALALEVLDLNQAIEASREAIARALGERASLELALEPGLPPVLGDRGCLESLLLELAANGRDAMPQGGRLRISTGRASGPPGEEEPEFVTLAVSDTGAGMSPEATRHLFEPFFTTKAGGHAKGLGLAAVYGIVRQFGGRIAAASQPGEGTTFTIHLRVGRGSDASPETRSQA